MNKRIFSKYDNNLNYQDYIKIKSGIQTLKSIKNENNVAILKRFNNYNNWQTLSSAYFPFIINNDIDIKYVKNTANADESFTYKHPENFDECIYRNTLYPYGKILSNRVVNSQFPTNIYMSNWCNSKYYSNKRLYEICDYKNSCKDNSCNCDEKKSHCSLCRNARALFI